MRPSQGRVIWNCKVSQDGQIPQYNDDEIDLFELIETLWNEKLLITFITAVFAVGGISYSLLATPEYQATSTLLPPTQKDIAELTKADNLAFVESATTTTTTTTTVYELFARVLNSNNLKKLFLETPQAQAALVKDGVTGEKLWKAVNEAVKVNVPTKGALEKIDVVASHFDRQQAASLANVFVGLAMTVTREQLVSDFKEGLSQRISAVRGQIASREATYVQNIESELMKLQSALNIARKINQTTPIDVQQLTEESSTTLMVDELRRLYRLGSNALEAEIAMLNERKKSKDLVPGLSDLQQQLALLEATSIDAERVYPAQVDLVAMVPESRVKPKRTLIVALAIVLGGMIGVVFVLIRQAVRNRQARAAA